MRIFISHSHADAQFAAGLVRELELAGYSCWIAPRDIQPGTDYAEAIVRAIGDCAWMVVLISPSAIESPHVLRELDLSMSGTRLMPIAIGDSTNPDDLPGGWRYRISFQQIGRASSVAEAATQVIGTVVATSGGKGRRSDTLRGDTVPRKVVPAPVIGPVRDALPRPLTAGQIESLRTKHRQDEFLVAAAPVAPARGAQPRLALTSTGRILRWTARGVAEEPWTPDGPFGAADPAAAKRLPMMLLEEEYAVELLPAEGGTRVTTNRDRVFLLAAARTPARAAPAGASRIPPPRAAARPSAPSTTTASNQRRKVTREAVELPAATVLRFEPPDAFREQVLAWANANGGRTVALRAQWKVIGSRRLVWRKDSQAYSISALTNLIMEQAAPGAAAIQPMAHWVLARGGQSLADLVRSHAPQATGSRAELADWSEMPV